MELSQDLIIDVALNAVGYIAAAALVMTVLSLFRRNSATAAAPAESTEVVEVAKTAPPPAPVKLAAGAAKMEFLKLSGDSPAGAEEARAESAEDPESTEKTDSGRRDRSEIIRVAREMLKAGATAEKITSILPVSQAELAMLSGGRR